MARRFKADVVTDAQAVSANLVDAARNQIPFASSLALNESALEAQRGVRRELPFRFKIRNTGVSKGIRVDKRLSHKRFWPRLVVRVGTIDAFMVPHETGQDKKPTRGRSIAIPTRAITRTRRSGRIPKPKKPARLLKERKAITTGKRGKGVIRRPREARKGRAKFAGRASILYFLRRRARMKRRWDFKSTVHGQAMESMPRNFRAAMRIAFRSRRVRGGSFSSKGGRAAFMSALAREQRMADAAIRGGGPFR